MKNTKNKKGISPFIAAVLLIIISVVIGVIVANFIRGFIGGTLDETRRQDVRGINCALNVNFEVYKIGGVSQIFKNETDLTVTIRNIGSIDIENFLVSILTENNVSQDLMEGENLPVAGIKRYMYNHNLSEEFLEVRITPIIKQGAQSLECLNIEVSFAGSEIIDI